MGEVLFPSIRRRLLARFYAIPEKRYYAGEVARIIGASLPPVRHELAILTEVGILDTEKSGHHTYYWLNPSCMIYEELQGIIIKTFGVAEIIRSALRPHVKKITAAFVYGSVAAGTDTAKSDIDLMVIGRLSFRELSAALGEFEEELGRPVNPTLFSREEFMEKWKAGNHFVRAVLRTKMTFIVGTDDDLRKLAGK